MRIMCGVLMSEIGFANFDTRLNSDTSNRVQTFLADANTLAVAIWCTQPSRLDRTRQRSDKFEHLTTRYSASQNHEKAEEIAARSKLSLNIVPIESKPLHFDPLHRPQHDLCFIHLLCLPC